MAMVLAIVCAVHGLVHLLGAAKGFRLALLPQLAQPVSVAGGVLWLAAAALFLGTSVALTAWPRAWWALGGAAIIVSMIAILQSWSDAKFGVIPNALVLSAVVVGFMIEGPLSLHAQYDRDVRAGAAPATGSEVIVETDLAKLPPPVQRYLRLAGVVGQPRVRSVFVRMHGRIRQDPASPWMPLTAEQHNVIDTRARHFYLTSSMLALPVRGYHRYVDGSANMRVKVAGLVTLARASGNEMTQAETVTLLNDMALLAPATLIDPGIEWEALGPHRARATFTTGAQTIRADLVFNDAGELVNFISDDRYQTSSGGSSPRRLRWSTPLRDYRLFGRTRLASSGEGRWHDAAGAYSYIELTIDEVRYNDEHR